MDKHTTTQNALPEKATWGLLGALAAGIAASVCCLGPLVLVALGATGAWIGNLSALEPYRPLFMLAASGFLAFAYYRVYRSQPEACEPGSACARPGAKTINKVSLWLITLVVAGLFVSPYLVGQLAAGAQQAQPVATETVSLSVENMTDRRQPLLPVALTHPKGYPARAVASRICYRSVLDKEARWQWASAWQPGRS